VSPTQSAGEGKGRSGAKPSTSQSSASSGTGKPSQGTRSASQSGGQRPNPRTPSQKNAGNRTVTPKSVKQRPAASGSGGKGGRQGPPRGRGPGGGASQPERSAGPSPRLLGLGAIVVVVIVVLVIVLVGINRHPAQKTSGNGDSPRSAATTALVTQVTSVPASVFQSIGLPSEITNYPKKVTKKESPLTINGLPVFLYEGAEYCPFCAAERWSMVMALSRFGTFSGLQTTYSSVSDFAPDTATFSFHGSTYKSTYVIFKPYELATNQQAASTTACNVNGYACLETPPTKYYNLLESVGGGSFPFMDFNNKIYQSGAEFENQPLTLQGLTYDQIASYLQNPSQSSNAKQVADAEVGSANYITAAICRITNNQPGDVCSASYIKAALNKQGV
jgi:Domain of unknown function (DUF929)